MYMQIFNVTVIIAAIMKSGLILLLAVVIIIMNLNFVLVFKKHGQYAAIVTLSMVSIPLFLPLFTTSSV